MDPCEIRTIGMVSDVCTTIDPQMLPGPQQVSFPRPPERLPRQEPIYLDPTHKKVFEILRQESPDTHASVSPAPYLACLEHAVIAAHKFLVVDQSGTVLSDSYFDRPRLLTNALTELGAAEQGVIPVSREIEAPCVMLGSPWSDGFYHWIFDVLPRFLILDPLLSSPDGKSLRLVTTRLTHFQRETLLRLGIDLDRVLEFDLSAWRFHRLYVAGRLNHHMSTTPDSIAWLRAHLAPRHPSGPEKIYVTRRDTDRRRVVNEAALEALLQRRGFTVVNPSRLPFWEQVEHFASARTILAPHGGALAHLAFTPPGATVIELMPESHVVFSSYNAARCGGSQYLFVLCPTQGPDSDIVVPLETLEGILG